jgi:hypothetical protein
MGKATGARTSHWEALVRMYTPHPPGWGLRIYTILLRE